MNPDFGAKRGERDQERGSPRAHTHKPFVSQKEEEEEKEEERDGFNPLLSPSSHGTAQKQNILPGEERASVASNLVTPLLLSQMNKKKKRGGF